ncbi:MAG: hypothetical protein R6X14_08875 [bacterium]
MLRVFITLSLVAAAAFGQPEIPAAAYWGRPTGWSSGREVVPGAGWFDTGPGQVFLRPARLGFADRPGVELGFAGRALSEQRTRLVYDQFENAIGELVVADNLTGAWLAGPVAAALPLAGLATVAVGLRPVADYNYSYQKDYRDDFYVVIGTDRVAASGTLYEAAGGIGVRPVRWLAAGASAGYRFGRREVLVELARYEDTTRYEESGRPAGLGYAAGLVLEPVAGFQLDAGYDGGLTLADWRSAAAEDAAVGRGQPWQARLGVAYFAPGVLPSRVTAEAGYTGWAAVDSGWSNVLAVRAGVEHTLAGALRLRYGAGVEPLPYATEIHRVLAGAGLGWDAGIARFDAGFSVGREVFGAGQFPAGLNPPDQQVYQTGTGFALTVSRDF